MTNTYVTELYYYAEDLADAVECCKSDNGRFEKELEQCNLVDEVYVASLSEERKINAACWVLISRGFGMNKYVEPFKNETEAKNFVRHSDDYASRYTITESVDELREFCNRIAADWTKYIHISVLEDTNS